MTKYVVMGALWLLQPNNLWQDALVERRYKNQPPGLLERIVKVVDDCHSVAMIDEAQHRVGTCSIPSLIRKVQGAGLPAQPPLLMQ